jgi:hypothetical protein
MARMARMARMALTRLLSLFHGVARHQHSLAPLGGRRLEVS